MLKNALIFWGYLKHFLILPRVSIYRIMIGPSLILERHNKTMLVPAFFLNFRIYVKKQRLAHKIKSLHYFKNYYNVFIVAKED